MTWLALWLGAAAVALPIGLVAMIAKAQRHAVPLWSPAGRRFAQVGIPAGTPSRPRFSPMLLVRQGHFELPGVHVAAALRLQG